MSATSQKEHYTRILSLIDFTSLDGRDNDRSVAEHCRKAMRFGASGLPMPAAVCIFSPFIATALRELSGTGIRVATVAGGFPHGQIPIQAKLEEVSFAIDQGADEIDLVFSRGLFIAGDRRKIFDEIAIIRENCAGLTLKVILETGELGTPGLIADASELALSAGADFIKTSTGKIPEGATEQSVEVMLQQLKRFRDSTGISRGIKPAGGISEPEQALAYYHRVRSTLGESWLTKDHFRIGASRLSGKLAAAILREEE